MGWVHNASSRVDAVSEWPTILGVCLGLTTLMTATVGMRIYVRAIMIKSVGIDDYVMLFSMVCSIIYNALCVAQSRYGLGLPIALRPVVNLNKYSEINFAGRPFYMAGITGFKVALCFAYLRITGNNIKSGYRKIIWAFMVFTVLSHLGGTLVLFFQCSPVHKSWRPRTPGTCLPNDITFYVLAVNSIICDIATFTLPIPLLAKLQINTRRKVGLIAIFTLGMFTTICSIMRMVQITTIKKNGNSTMLVLWGTIEMNVGISLTCLPSLTPLFTYFANKAKTSHYYRKGRDNYASDHSVQLRKVANDRQSQGETGMTRSDSEEHILASGGKELQITKTTEVVHEYDKERSYLRRSDW